MYGLARRDPLSEVVSLRTAMDRLFEDSFVSPMRRHGRNGERAMPAIDVAETDDEVVIKAALPGIDPKDVDVTMTGSNLVIRGEFKADEKIERERYIHSERRFGSFLRQMQLPVRVQGDKAEGNFENGLLTLHIPKAEEAKPRQIQVKINGAHGGSDGADAELEGDHA